MSDSEDVLSPKQQLLCKQRKEKKALQGEIQTIKKSVPKGDRKQDKAAKAKIVELETALKLRHTNELEMFQEQEESIKSESDVASDISNLSVANNNVDETMKKSSKISKAQKKRNKKAAKAKEYSKLCDTAEMEYTKSAKFQEEEAIKKILAEMNLKGKQIKSDGDCMYSAIHDQLDKTLHLTVPELRMKVSEHINANKNDFIPFLTNASGDQFTDEEFNKYCADIKQQGVWGGQLELRALANVLKFPIHVIQANTPTVILGEEHDSKPIILSYHRHELGLGEHYNSVTALGDVASDTPNGSR